MTYALHWDLLRQGKIQQGLAMAREGYARDPYPWRMDLGIAYLWAEEYPAACEHFQHRIDVEPFTVSTFFEMAGVARWCAEDPDGAVKYWRQGLPSQLADAGVAISLPLLLFTASILKSKVFSREDAERILRRQLQNPRAEKWPGPLAKFVLGQIDWDSLEKLCLDKRPRTTALQKWRARFYNGVVEFAHSGTSEAELKDAMRQAADTSRPEWFEQRAFLNLVWSPEFFIARYEATH